MKITDFKTVLFNYLNMKIYEDIKIIENVLGTSENEIQRVLFENRPALYCFNYIFITAYKIYIF